MTKRIEWIDTAKGLAIILVVYGHALEGVFYNVGMNVQSYTIQHTFIYAFHMPLFFILSGVFLSDWLKRSPTIALKQKVKTLLIPYIIWSIIQGAFMLLAHSSSITKIGWKRLLTIPINPIDQFWFIYVLFFALIVYYLIYNYILKSTFEMLILSFITVIITSFISTWQFYNLGIAFFFLSIGAFVKRHYSLNIFSGDRIWGVSSILFLLAFLPIFLIKPLLLSNIIIKLLLGTCGSVATMCTATHIHLNLLKKFGKLSLAIYVTHWIFLAGIRFLLIHLHMIDGLALLLLTTLSGCFLPLIFYKAMHMLGLQRFLF